MGVAVSTSVDTAVNNERSTTMQIAQNDCSANCTQIQQGTTIVLTNTQTGNITFDQQCSADASCYMSNAVDQAVTEFQKAQASGTASPTLFPGIQINTTVNTTVNDISNSLTQILQNFCHANVNQTQQDTLIYATNSKTGDISFVQNGNAHAQCVMENTARMKLSMQQQGTATGTAGSQIGAIAGAIIAVIIIVVVIIAVIGIARNTINKKKPGEQEGQGGRAPRRQPTSIPRRR